MRVSNCNLTNKIIIGYNRALTIKYLKGNKLGCQVHRQKQFGDWQNVYILEMYVNHQYNMLAVINDGKLKNLSLMKDSQHNGYTR